MTDTVHQQTAGNKTLPAQWVSVELPTLIEKVSVTSKKLKQKEYERSGKYPVIDQGQEFIAGYSDATHLVTEPQSPVVIFGDHTRAVKYVDFPFIAGADGIKVMRPVGLDPEYFYYLMRWLPLPDKGYARHYQYVEKSSIPLPPFNEQRRIVEKIEELFTKLDAGVRSLEQTRALLKSYRRSVLKAAVEGELSREWREAHRDELEPASELLERILKERREKFSGKKYKEPASPDTSDLSTLRDGWQRVTIDQVSNEVRYGSSAKTNEDSTGVPVLRMGNIQNGQLVTDSLKYLPTEHEEFPDLHLRPGDLLFNRTNSYELVGKTGIFTGTLDPCSFASYLIRVRFLSGVLPKFVAYFINSAYGREWISSVVSQQVGQANVNGTKLKALVMPLPPQAEQNIIVEEVERRLSVVDKLEATVEANLKQADALRQSILKQAFSGELVPQDPDDESASVLLERIRSERQAAKPKASKGRKSNARTTKRDHADQGGLF